MALDARQAVDPVALEEPVQRGSREVRDRCLERVETILERQPRVSTKRHDQGFFGWREHRRPRDLRAHRSVLETRAPPPLGDRLRVDAVALAQRLERSRRSLYCCSDGVSGRGASVKYLSHSVSLVVASILPPPHCGTKHPSDPLRAIDVCCERRRPSCDMRIGLLSINWADLRRNDACLARRYVARALSGEACFGW